VTARRRAASRTRAGALALALLAALALPASASAGRAPTARGSVRLSDERSLTHWAHPVQRAPIRTRPTTRAGQIVPTHYLTEDGFPEVYLVLRSWSDSSGHTWLEVRIPMRPNGRTGWVRDSALGPLYRVRTRLVVDRPKLRATLYKRGRRLWSASVGIGKPSTPTPAGHFWIREKFKTHGSGGLYGPVAFGTSDYSVLSDWPGGGIIGIHGTDEPFLIPGRPSHGCIRVQNRAVRRLWRLMPIGTPLLIR
jgi:L,D-transpeptidase-like protein